MYLRKRVLNAALRPLVPLVLRAPPPLNHVRLRSENSQLDLSVTDGATWLSMSVACEGGDLDATIPAGPLRDFIAGADRDSCVEFVGHGRHVDVAFELCLTTFDTASLDDIPRRPDEASSTVWRRDAEWDAGALRDALAWVLPAVGRDATRPSLAAVLFDSGSVVATDGHRLHIARLAGPRSQSFTIGGAIATALLHVLEDGRVVLERLREHVRFVGRGWNVIARVGEAVFPPYRRALPSKQAESCHVEVEPSTIAAALKTLSRRLRPRPHGVRMKINGHLVFEHQAEDARVVRAEVPVVRSTHRSEDLILGVSLRYLADAVAGTGLETMRFGGPLDPLVVEHEDKRIAVVMPMRI